MKGTLPSRSRLWIVFAAMSVTSLSAQAPSKQPVPGVSFRYRDNPPPAKPSVSPGKGSAAAPHELIVHVELQEGWHINSQAPLDSFLVATRVEAQAEGLAFGNPVYPKAEVKPSAVMGGEIALFTGAFDIRIPFAAKASVYKPGSPPRTRVTLNYQSCNDNMCLPPKSVTVEQ